MLSTYPQARMNISRKWRQGLDYYALTGLTWGQLTRLSILVFGETGPLVKKDAKKPPAVGLFDSVAMVVRGTGPPASTRN
jgi:hypothetical protein